MSKLGGAIVGPHLSKTCRGASAIERNHCTPPTQEKLGPMRLGVRDGVYSGKVGKLLEDWHVGKFGSLVN